MYYLYENENECYEAVRQSNYAISIQKPLKSFVEVTWTVAQYSNAPWTVVLHTYDPYIQLIIRYRNEWIFATDCMPYYPAGQCALNSARTRLYCEFYLWALNARRRPHWPAKMYKNHTSKPVLAYKACTKNTQPITWSWAEHASKLEWHRNRAKQNKKAKPINY